MLANAMVLDAPFMAAHLNSNMDWGIHHSMINDARENEGPRFGERFTLMRPALPLLLPIFLRKQVWLKNGDHLFGRCEPLMAPVGTKPRRRRHSQNDPGRAIVIYNNRRKTSVNGWRSQESSSFLTVWLSRMQEELLPLGFTL